MVVNVFHLVPKSAVLNTKNVILKRLWLEPDLELKASSAKEGVENLHSVRMTHICACLFTHTHAIMRISEPYTRNQDVPSEMPPEILSVTIVAHCSVKRTTFYTDTLLIFLVCSALKPQKKAKKSKEEAEEDVCEAEQLVKAGKHLHK